MQTFRLAHLHSHHLLRSLSRPMSHSRTSFPASSALFSHQDQLPSLPIPSLEQTIQTLLATAKPLANSPQEFEKLRSLAQQFEGGEGKILQHRLLDHQKSEAKAGKRNWMATWWLENAYLKYRDPVVVWVNYFFAFKDDQALRFVKDRASARAASIIQGAMTFRDMVVSGELEAEGSKAGKFCSEQYKYLFNATRIPVIPADVVKVSDHATNSHIILIRRNKFFTLELQPGGIRLSTPQIQAQIDKIYLMADSTPAEEGVGLLTTLPRDEWTHARDELVGLGDNGALLDVLERAAFVVCLDEGAPITKEEHSVGCWHGNGSNRWFDKSMQFIVYDNGKAGFNGEHSNMEATITHRCCDWILESLSKNTLNHRLDQPARSIADPVKLSFTLSPQSAATIAHAHQLFAALTASHTLKVVVSATFGKNLIKTFKVSPDAFVQMAFQLAYYRMEGRACGTYESAGTRKYIGGRTETGRSVSQDSLNFCQIWSSPSHSDAERVRSARAGIAAQSAYMKMAGDGFGVDRHFMGLKMVRGEGEAVPALFSDALFVRSGRWVLSTSQVTSEHYDGYGWGESYPDGFGCAYMIKNAAIQVNLVSQKGNRAGMANEHFGALLVEALEEMREVFERSIIKAKL